MKVKLKLIKIERKGMAGLIALLGVALILCVVAFPTPNDISVGEMAYQKLWLGRMTVVFAVCCLPFLCLNKKQYLSFPSIVTWVLIILGGIEAIWGLRQIYGFAVSNHSLYALTGSFYNPGPYSGYLAMIFPLCLHGIRSDAVDSLCATCRNESFGLDCRRRIGRMGVWNAHFMGK